MRAWYDPEQRPPTPQEAMREIVGGIALFAIVIALYIFWMAAGGPP